MNNKNSIKDNLVIHTNNELYNIPPSQIVYIAADGNYSSIHLLSGEEFVVTFQLGRIAELISEQLPFSQNILVRVGRGVIVNINEVLYINTQRNNILMNKGNGDRIVLSASHNALKSLMDYIIEKKKDENISQPLSNAIPFDNVMQHASSFNFCGNQGSKSRAVLRKNTRKKEEFSDDEIAILCGDF